MKSNFHIICEVRLNNYKTNSKSNKCNKYFILQCVHCKFFIGPDLQVEVMTVHKYCVCRVFRCALLVFADGEGNLYVEI